MKPLLLALLLAAACKHSTSSSSTSHSETSTVTDTKTSESGSQTTTTVVTEAPGETTTTVSEYAPPEKEAAPEQEPPPDAGSGATRLGQPKVPRHGPLVKRTVTTTRSGGETSQTVQQATREAQGTSETKAAGKQDVTAKAQEASSPSAGCVGASWIWGLAVLVGVVGIVYFAVKMRRV